MHGGNAMPLPTPVGPRALTLDKRFDNTPSLKAIAALGEFAQIVEKPFLAGARVDGFYRAWVENIAKEHFKKLSDHLGPIGLARSAGIDPTYVSIATPIHDIDATMFFIPENEGLACPRAPFASPLRRPKETESSLPFPQ